MQIGFRLDHLLPKTVAVFPVGGHFLAGNPDRQAAAAAQGSAGRPRKRGIRSAPGAGQRRPALGPAAAWGAGPGSPSSPQPPPGPRLPLRGGGVCSAPAGPVATRGPGRAALRSPATWRWGGGWSQVHSPQPALRIGTPDQNRTHI